MTLILINNSKYLNSLSMLESKEILSRIKKVVDTYRDDLITVADDYFFSNKVPVIRTVPDNIMKVLEVREPEYYEKIVNADYIKVEDAQIPMITLGMSDDEYNKIMTKIIDTEKTKGLVLLLKAVERVIFIELGSAGWIKHDTIFSNVSSELIHIMQTKTKYYKDRVMYKEE